ncbi:MAG TPA: serine hydrolase domain-containing protein, partial [Rubricoccaceae bacterium]
LLSMRSGMGDFDTDPDYRNYHASLPGLRSTDDYLALFADDTLLFDPGTDTAYSNAGYVVLGKVIERVSGQSYYDYVREHVFDPAGMTGTGYFTPDDDVPNLAVGYTKNPIASEAESQLAEGSVERSPNTSLLAYRGSSAGGGYSTAEDFLRLSRALLAHRLMGPEATYAMLGSRFNAPDPEAFDLDGWRGGSEGINTVFLVFSTGHTLVVLTNYDPPVATTISREFMGEWLPAWLETSRDDSSHPGSRRP